MACATFCTFAFACKTLKANRGKVKRAKSAHASITAIHGVVWVLAGSEVVVKNMERQQLPISISFYDL